jgi:hypothetical protein
LITSRGKRRSRCVGSLAEWRVPAASGRRSTLRSAMRRRLVFYREMARRGPHYDRRIDHVVRAAWDSFRSRRSSSAIRPPNRQPHAERTLDSRHISNVPGDIARGNIRRLGSSSHLTGDSDWGCEAHARVRS